MGPRSNINKPVSAKRGNARSVRSSTASARETAVARPAGGRGIASKRKTRSGARPRRTVVMIYREHDSAGRVLRLELPRISAVGAMVYGTVATGLLLFGLLIHTIAFADSSDFLGGDAISAGGPEAGKRLLASALESRAKLERLQELHEAINARLFIGPEVNAGWFTLPQLMPHESAAAGSAGAHATGADALFAGAGFASAALDDDDSPGGIEDAAGRRLSPADLRRRLAGLDQLFQQNKNYVQVYGGYLRGVPHRWPVVYGPRKINSNFGYRANPFYNRGQGGGGARKLHRGVDLKGKRGDLVVAAAEGVVLEARKSSRGYGNRVRIFHPSGYVTLYAHLSAIYVKRDQYIRPGDRVGAVGSTGHSTGPHLHYEVHHLGKAINPAEFIAEE